MKNSVIADTGFWYAFINADDYFYRQATEFLSTLTETLITAWPVITETGYLLPSRMGQQDACRFLALYHQGLYEIIHLSANGMRQMVVLMQKYANLPMDLADASLVILAEQLGYGRILSTDQRDFNTYRWKNHQPFQNLLLPEP